MLLSTDPAAKPPLPWVTIHMSNSWLLPSIYGVQTSGKENRFFPDEPIKTKVLKNDHLVY